MLNLDEKQAAQKIIQFLATVFKTQQKSKAVIAVSGGIDSALSLSLLVQAIGADKIYPLFLPYGQQNMADAETVVAWNKIPKANIQTVNIAPMVDNFAQALKIDEVDKVRLGNLMARARMMVVFDQAKKLDALVCGTENKSENFLAYFTRFGDEASDIEPIVHLYKTQVRLLAQHLNLPQVFLDKAPSAGLWNEQTDEKEFGFTYQEADLFFMKLEEAGAIDDEGKLNVEAKKLAETDNEQTILNWVESVQFKHLVPYQFKK